MDSLETAHRFHFAFTITYHYLFPQLTMGLAFIIALLKTRALRWGDERANEAARFLAKILGVNFVMGVVTGIPMEFQFGTNWSRFSELAGPVIGQTLAMEGVFAFFLESSFLYILLFGERRFGPRLHWLSAVLVTLGSWLSGFFIVVTNAWMQHPVGVVRGPGGRFELDGLAPLFTNPWMPWQYAHTMLGSLITGGVVVAALGAFYCLRGEQGRRGELARLLLRTGVGVGFVAATLSAFPTGDVQAKNVLEHQPTTFAAMEGHFETEVGASMVLVGQPDMERLEIDNAITVPNVLSLLTHKRWEAEIKGLKTYPREDWPDNIPLLYYAYHFMVGLGTIFIATLGGAALLLWRGGDRLYRWRWPLWVLMLLAPFPFIANTAGWMTAELGRQPWLVYGHLRTAEGFSDHVSTGNVLFSLLGFMGLYALLSLLYVLLVGRIVAAGPAPAPAPVEGEHGA